MKLSGIRQSKATLGMHLGTFASFIMGYDQNAENITFNAL
jgi:hypothetical protein